MPQADGRIYLQLTKGNTAYCDHDIVNEPKGQMAEGVDSLICFLLTRVWVIKWQCPADSTDRPLPSSSEPFVHFSGVFSPSFPHHLSTFYHSSSIFSIQTTGDLAKWLLMYIWDTATSVPAAPTFGNSRAHRTSCGMSPAALPRPHQCVLQ